MNNKCKHAILTMTGLALLSSVAAADPYEKYVKKLVKGVKKLEGDKIAVLPLKHLEVPGSPGGKIISERLMTLLADQKEVQLIERNLIEKIFEEKKLELMGITEERTEREIGKILGAEGIITGTIHEIGINELELNLRLISVRDGKVLSAASGKVLKTWTDPSMELQNGIFVSELSFGGGIKASIPAVSIASRHQEMKKLNIEAEELLDEANRADSDNAILPIEKAEAWCKLASIKDSNPYLDEASNACTQWQEYAKTWITFRDNLQPDLDKLRRYNELDRSNEQKLAVMDAFLAAYSDMANEWPSVFLGAVNEVTNLHWSLKELGTTDVNIEIKGLVMSPGIYPYRKGMHLSEVINRAGLRTFRTTDGYSDEFTANYIEIRRQEEFGKITKSKIKIKSSAPEKDVELMPYDSINVVYKIKPSWRFYLYSFAFLFPLVGLLFI